MTGSPLATRAVIVSPENVAPLNPCRRAAVLLACDIAQTNWRRLKVVASAGWHTYRPPRKIRSATFSDDRDGLTSRPATREGSRRSASVATAGTASSIAVSWRQRCRSWAGVWARLRAWPAGTWACRGQSFRRCHDMPFGTSLTRIWKRSIRICEPSRRSTTASPTLSSHRRRRTDLASSPPLRRVVRQFQRQPPRSPRSPNGIPMLWLGGFGVLGGLRQTEAARFSACRHRAEAEYAKLHW